MPNDSQKSLIPSWQLIGGFALVCLIWGSSWAAVRLNVEAFPPALSSGIRFVIATVLLGILAWIQRIRIPRDRTFWLLASYLAMTAVTIPFGLVYWGQQRVDSGLSSILFGTFPFWVAMMAHTVLPNERITWMKGIGIMVGFGGIALLSNTVGSVPTTDSALGMGAIVVAASFQASALVAIRKHGGPYHVVPLNLIPMAVGAILLLLWSALVEPRTEIRLTLPVVSSLVYLAAFSTVLTFVLYYWLAKHVEAVLLSFSAFITPLIAVMTGWLLLGESLTRTQLAGSALVLVGIALATMVRRRPNSGVAKKNE